MKLFSFIFLHSTKTPDHVNFKVEFSHFSYTLPELYLTIYVTHKFDVL